MGAIQLFIWPYSIYFLYLAPQIKAACMLCFVCWHSFTVTPQHSCDILLTKHTFNVLFVLVVNQDALHTRAWDVDISVCGKPRREWSNDVFPCWQPRITELKKRYTWKVLLCVNGCINWFRKVCSKMMHCQATSSRMCSPYSRVTNLFPRMLGTPSKLCCLVGWTRPAVFEVYFTVLFSRLAC